MFGTNKRLDQIIALLKQILAELRKETDVKTLGVTIDPPVQQGEKENG